ncbi:MAG: HlyD family efflux transporter periplasmic adaptor subunit [Bacteroidota bacterium]
MLNISENSIIGRVDTKKYKSFQETDLPKANTSFKRWLTGALLIFLIALFLPWTQNIQTRGKVTTLRPEQRPQTIHATIAGRVEKWFVKEGQLVNRGDTIVYISEIKTEYFDPNLVQRVGQQVEATIGGINSYGSKVSALENQIDAMRQEQKFKTEQLRNKVDQKRFKVNADSIALERAIIDLDIAHKQYQRTVNLRKEGLRSLTDVENKNLKVQETNAKKVEIENKLAASRNELANARLGLINISNEYANKISKAQSDKFTALSSQFDAESKLQKLQVEQENYRQRSGFYYIVAPQDCYITQAIVTGVGETVKEGEPIVSIMPYPAELAVEIFVKPIDLPLISMGNTVNFIFDGWPAFVFSGWPNLSFGTFEGKVVAIDNNIGADGNFRVLVGPDESLKKWPDALRPGGGAQAVALLNDVMLWYELWRQLNGFPPDFYKQEKVNVDPAKGKKL